jgi:hypothetical protein
MEKHLEQTISPEKKTIRQTMVEYFNTYYKKAAEHQAINNILGGMSIGDVSREHYKAEGDSYLKNENYTLAAAMYLKSTTSPSYYHEAFCKIGFCLLKGADPSVAELKKLRFYPEQDENSSKIELAAVFFREVLALNPGFKDGDYQSKIYEHTGNLVAQAIYYLSMCISSGAVIKPQDLLNTPFEDSPLENINSNELEIALLQRVLAIKPHFKEASAKLALLTSNVGEREPSSTLARVNACREDEVNPRRKMPCLASANLSNGQVYKLLLQNNIFQNKAEQQTAFRLSKELPREEYRSFVGNSSN